MLKIPDISVIIINYNSSAYTLMCVQSIIEQTKKNSFEIIIVDNQSKEEDYAALNSLSQYPFVKLFRSRLNVGFASGNMLGVQIANPDSKYYFFLNNDCELQNDVLSLLSTHLAENPQVALVTAQMLTSTGQPTASFGYYPTIGGMLLGHGFMRMLKSDMYPKNKMRYLDPVTIPYATGSALFVRADNFNKVGGFDTHYFLYCEEEDICKTLQNKGWQIQLVPQAQFIHHGGKSTARNLAIEKEFYISYFYFIKKFYSSTTYWTVRLFYFLKVVKKAYKGNIYWKLGLFILKGPSPKYSLKFQQEIKAKC